MGHGYFGRSRPQFYRSVFLSDFHIGAKSFDAAALVHFLQNIECETLYLVGDIIDGWKLNKRWYWTEECSRVLDELVAKASKGTRIIYLPGNHDEDVRKIMPYRRKRFARRMGIEIRDKVLHTTADGKRFLVLHGDQFDRKIIRGRLSIWSDRFYDRLMEWIGNYSSPQIVVKGKIKRFSLAKSLSKHGQWALHLLNNFEAAVYRMAARRGVDGLICGHTHIPVIKPINDILYANAGSWLRSGHTALVEHSCGDLQLIDWPASYESQQNLNPAFEHINKNYKLRPDLTAQRRITLSIIQSIRRVWPEKDHTAPIRSHEWIEIKQRDDVVIRRYAGLTEHALCKPVPDHNKLRLTIAYKPDQSWQEDLRKPLNLYEAFIFLR